MHKVKNFNGKVSVRKKLPKRYIDTAGYVRVKVGNYHVLEHRYLMELKLGRLLEKGEVVHHIDGNRLNNSLDNLKLISSSEHARLHNKGKPNYKTRGRHPVRIARKGSHWQTFRI